MSLAARVHWIRQHLCLPLLPRRRVGVEAPAAGRGPSGSTLGSATGEGTRGPFGGFSPMNRGFWQCKPIGRGVLWTHKYL